MAKRRRKKPNISEAVLDQARQGGAEPNADGDARWKEIQGDPAYQGLRRMRLN